MTKISNNKTLSPIEQLKAEKRALKATFTEDGQRLKENWDYLSDNVGPLLFNIVFNTAKGVIGGSKKARSREPEGEDTNTNFLSALVSNPNLSFLGIASSIFPLVWDIAQPMLIGFAVRKIKGLFSTKKKKDK